MFNPLCSDPTRFCLGTDTRTYVTEKGVSNECPKFVLVGLLQRWTLSSEGSSVSIAPDSVSWGRISAFIGHVLGSTVFYVHSSGNGLLFSTARFSQYTEYLSYFGSDESRELFLNATTHPADKHE